MIYYEVTQNTRSVARFIYEWQAYAFVRLITEIYKRRSCFEMPEYEIHEVERDSL